MAILPALSIACGGTSDLSGDYTVALTNGPNACVFEGWTEGRELTGVVFTVTQNEAEVTGQVGGAAGLYLGVLAGTNTFAGTISGADFEMRLVGVRSQTEDQCRYTVDVVATGAIENDAISGKLTYVPKTSGTGCRFQDCQNTQAFAGARPPTGG
jgi:hypothetical protein